MNELLEKISSYNIFNYLLPGALFAVLATRLTSYDLSQTDVVTGAFTYYFIGLVISRIGSLLVEPALKKLGVVTFAPYADFVSASSSDAKLEVLSEVNNMYRTLASLSLCLLATMVFDQLAGTCLQVRSGVPYLLVTLLATLFVFSYRKQTDYIRSSLQAILNDTGADPQ